MGEAAGVRHRGRIGIGVWMSVCCLALAACQSGPGHSVAQHAAPAAHSPAASPTGTTPAPSKSADSERTITDDAEAASLQVFLADTKPRSDWQAVPLKPSGVLYVRTPAVIDRSDLIGIRSASDGADKGVLVLILSDTGLDKLRDATTRNPGLRLALVVGQTMLAAPGYASPIREQQVAFEVGSVRNADLAARSVAGQARRPADDS